MGSICELTNPFMNMRYFLSTMELRASRLYMANGVAFVLAWLVVRICYAISHAGYIIYRQRAMWTQLPLWRAAARVFTFTSTPADTHLRTLFPAFLCTFPPSIVRLLCGRHTQ